MLNRGGSRTRDPCITSNVLYHWAIQVNIHGPSSSNYHIPALTEFLPSKKTHNKQKFTLSGPSDFTNAWLVRAAKVTEMRRNIEINDFLRGRRKMFEQKWFFKDNTDLIPHLHPWTCRSTWMRRTYGLLIIFYKEVEIVYVLDSNHSEQWKVFID